MSYFFYRHQRPSVANHIHFYLAHQDNNQRLLQLKPTLASTMSSGRSQTRSSALVSNELSGYKLYHVDSLALAPYTRARVKAKNNHKHKLCTRLTKIVCTIRNYVRLPPLQLDTTNEYKRSIECKQVTLRDVHKSETNLLKDELTELDEPEDVPAWAGGSYFALEASRRYQWCNLVVPESCQGGARSRFVQHL